ncbi:hypothetical protein CAC42_362 [Sphaceloma murrayae]|uniref:LITAF domain-containing protein n=1 Tax=Sphaceloma murrayae TaxID=2082308 RepID=A0A2K1R002_9PEZI|nr:hypothetical protein CAC42_362 [Sphaceloma murrayae]
MASDKIIAPQDEDSGLRPATSQQSQQPSPISPNSTGTVSDGPVSHQTTPVPMASPSDMAPAATRTTANVTPQAASDDVTPAPPTYDSAIRERYGETEKPNGPQPVGPAPIMVTPLTAIGRAETTVDCPRCRQAVKTRIERHVGQRATIWSIVICLCVGCLCAWIPCVMDDCKDVEHYCAQCNLALATVSAGGAVELSQAARKAAETASQHPGQAGQPTGFATSLGEAEQGSAGTQQQRLHEQYSSTAQMHQPTPVQQPHGQQPVQQTGHVDANGRAIAELGN